MFCFSALANNVVCPLMGSTESQGWLSLTSFIVNSRRASGIVVLACNGLAEVSVASREHLRVSVDSAILLANNAHFVRQPLLVYQLIRKHGYHTFAFALDIQVPVRDLPVSFEHLLEIEKGLYSTACRRKHCEERANPFSNLRQRLRDRDKQQRSEKHIDDNRDRAKQTVVKMVTLTFPRNS